MWVEARQPTPGGQPPRRPPGMRDKSHPAPDSCRAELQVSKCSRHGAWHGQSAERSACQRAPPCAAQAHSLPWRLRCSAHTLPEKVNCRALMFTETLQGGEGVGQTPVTARRARYASPGLNKPWVRCLHVKPSSHSTARRPAPCLPSRRCQLGVRGGEELGGGELGLAAAAGAGQGAHIAAMARQVRWGGHFTACMPLGPLRLRCTSLRRGAEMCCMAGAGIIQQGSRMKRVALHVLPELTRASARKWASA